MPGAFRSIVTAWRTSSITAMALIRRVGGMDMVSSPVLNSLFRLSLPLMNGTPKPIAQS